MSSFPTGIMDDAGFTTVRAKAAARPLPVVLSGRLVARPARRRNPALAWGLGAMAALHAAVLAPVVLARPELKEWLVHDEPMTVFIDMAPPPAAPPTPRPKTAETSPPPPPTRSEPLPFTPRESVAPVTPPAEVSPFTPPRPEPVAAPAQTAPARTTEPAAEPAPAKPASPGTGSSPGAASSEFNARVMAALAKAKRYPPDARARREEGVAMIAITLNRSGRVLNAEITRSSGSKSLDRAALETARRAAMPKVPAELSDPVRVVVALEFAMK